MLLTCGSRRASGVLVCPCPIARSDDDAGPAPLATKAASPLTHRRPHPFTSECVTAAPDALSRSSYDSKSFPRMFSSWMDCLDRRGIYRCIYTVQVYICIS